MAPARSTVDAQAVALPPVPASGLECPHLQPVAAAAITVKAGTADQDAHAMAVMMMAMRQRDGGQGTGQQDGGAEHQGRYFADAKFGRGHDTTPYRFDCRLMPTVCPVVAAAAQ